MSWLYIAEFDSVGIDALGQTVLAGASAASAPFSSATRFVEYSCDVACSVMFGTTPVADPAYRRLGAGDTRYATIKPGRSLAIAVIANT